MIAKLFRVRNTDIPPLVLTYKCDRLSSDGRSSIDARPDARPDAWAVSRPTPISTIGGVLCRRAALLMFCVVDDFLWVSLMFECDRQSEMGRDGGTVPPISPSKIPTHLTLSGRVRGRMRSHPAAPRASTTRPRATRPMQCVGHSASHVAKFSFLRACYF